MLHDHGVPLGDHPAHSRRHCRTNNRGRLQSQEKITIDYLTVKALQQKSCPASDADASGYQLKGMPLPESNIGVYYHREAAFSVFGAAAYFVFSWLSVHVYDSEEYHSG